MFELLENTETEEGLTDDLINEWEYILAYVTILRLRLKC